MKTDKKSFLRRINHVEFLTAYSVILLIFILLGNSLSAQTKSANSASSFKGLIGDGSSPGNPVQIATLDHLRLVSEDPDFRDKHLALVADIDATDTKNWNVGNHDNDDETPEVAMGFIPIGYYHSEPTRFRGSFEGNGHTISNLYIYHQKSSGDHAGLFGSVQTDWYIRNVNLANVNFTCKYGGGLISNIHKGYVKNCHTSGSVKGTWGFLGGIIGSTSYMVNNKSIDIDLCSSSCDVVGYHPTLTVSSAGGLIGVAFAYGHDGEYLSITNCSASGNITSNGQIIGGLIGTASDSILIRNCFATGNVVGLRKCGGLIGTCSGKGSEVQTTKVIDCYSSGNVSIIPGTENNSSTNSIGGFIGLIGSNVLIDGCKTTADSIATENATGVGGFIGANGGNYGHTLVKNSFAEVKSVAGGKRIGGFLGDGVGTGDNQITFENCHTISDVYTSDSTSTEAGGFAGWGPDYLLNCVSYGNVKSEGDFIGGFIGRSGGTKMENCYSFGETVIGNDKIGGFIGNDFTDTLINCHTMVNIVTGNKDVGGFLGTSSTNFNLGCTTRANVTATGDNTGGYAGYMTAWSSNQLIRCYAKGNVQSTGEKYTGGFIGKAGAITLLECYATGNVVGNQYVGGFCGLSENIIECFATGNVSGTQYVGGIAGRSYNITNSFATGNVTTTSYGGSIAAYWSTVLTSYGTGSIHGSGDYIGGAFGSMNTSSTKKCYFDQTVNPSLTGNGSGKFLDDCKGLSTSQFSNSGNFETWDFTDTWQMDVIDWIDVFERPYLKWQFLEDQSSPITSISIENQICKSVVNGNENLVTIAMPFGTDIANLALIFKLNDGAIMLINDSIQVSGVTSNNFIHPLMCYIIQPSNKSAFLNSKRIASDTLLWIIKVENQSHLLTFSATENGGFLNGLNEQLVEDNEASDPVEAIANEGYNFVHWESINGEILTTDSILVIESVSQSDNFTAIFELETGISASKNVDFGCYPNPTKGLLEVQFDQPYTGYVEVFSVTGVSSGKIWINNQVFASIDISVLNKGIYLIKVGNNNQKIIKL